MVNINQFMKQAQSMQKKMQEMQEEIAKKDYSGKSGGGLVNITANGRGEIMRISLDDSLIKLEEKEILEDLIVAAINDVKQKVDADMQGSFQSGLSGLGLPPGFKLPF